MNGPSNDTRPWLVAVASCDPAQGGNPGARMAAMYFEPWDLGPGQAIDPDDFDTVRSSFDTAAIPDVAAMTESAYRTGVSMSRMFHIDTVRVWPGLDAASKTIADELAYAPDPAAVPCEPDEDTKKLLRYALEALKASLDAQRA